MNDHLAARRFARSPAAPAPPPEIDSPEARARRHGRIAGVLFIGGAISSLPATLIHDPPLSPTVYLLTALGVVSGVICLFLPWERLQRRWFHEVVVLATIQVALVSMLVDISYRWYFVMIVVFAAYVFQSRRAIGGYLALVSLGVLTPVLYESGADSQSALQSGLIIIPTLVAAAGIVTYLREALERGQSAYQALARRDPLTGVGNYRELHERLWAEVSHSRRTGRPCALLLVDLDDFKSINEHQGHMVGDQILREVGARLSEAARASDTVVRHGGDEFSIIAPDTDHAGAVELSRRIQGLLGLVATRNGPLSASTGIAVFPNDATDPEHLIWQADHSLRAQKGDRRLFFARR